MRNRKPLAFLICLLFAQIYLTAQDKTNVKFGKISPADFDLKTRFDTTDNAVVIADIGNTTFEGNNKGRGHFTMVFKRYKRIKILNKNGFDVADERIPVYSDGELDELLVDLKAVTYNLEGGKVVENKLESKSIFVDKINKEQSYKKFTLPAVKEGSIIEISYTIKSDFVQHLREWQFEEKYPCLWSEYEVSVPEMFHYVVLTQGDQQFHIKNTEKHKNTYNVRVSGGASSNDSYNYVDVDDIISRWVKKDVPGFREEPYVTTTDNYVSKVEFQLSYFQWSITSEPQHFIGTWQSLSDELLKSEYFGAAIGKDNNWMNDDLKAITAACQNKQEKILKIYTYIRDHFTCTDHYEKYTDKPLKTVFKDKKGNVAEINLLLVAMLRHEEIDAEPIILSTRDNGFPSEQYPMLERFNYVICIARYENNNYLLDASRPYLGFNHLPDYCYNGSAKLISRDHSQSIDLSAESLLESKNTSVLIINDEKGFPSGSLQSTTGYVESYLIREEVTKKSQMDFFKHIQTLYGTDVELENENIDSLNKPEFPTTVKFDFNLKNFGHENLIYFNPMMGEVMKENPFKAAERKYPVEMPFKMQDVYTLTMDIPEGYSVDEMPKSVRIAYNEKEGMFEYLIQKNETAIQLRTSIKLNKANFAPEEYSTLRDFFAQIVKKQNEQIVFKKK